jgi:transmembrane sensor
MNAKPSTPTRAEIEAGEWLATMSQRLVTIDQRNEFEAWLKASPEHARAYETGKDVFQLATTCSDLLADTRAEEEAEFQSRRKRLKYSVVAAGVIVALSAVFFAGQEFSWFGSGKKFETSTAQVKDFRLDDGTLVTLGAASEVAVEFDKNERRVRLRRGEAFFEVTRDTNRPFVVMAGDTAVRVLGTQFNVHYGADAVRVAVAEGRVEVVKADETATAPVETPTTRAVLTAGETAVATRTGGIITSSSDDKEDLAAWRQGRLVYVDARLRDVVSDMNRYFDGEIELADEKLGERQLTITFRSDEIDRGLDMLHGVLPVQVVRTAPNRILLTRR